MLFLSGCARKVKLKNYLKLISELNITNESVTLYATIDRLPEIKVNQFNILSKMRSYSCKIKQPRLISMYFIEFNHLVMHKKKIYQKLAIYIILEFDY